MMILNRGANKAIFASVLAIALASAIFAVQSVFSSSPPDETVVFRGVLKERGNVVDGERNFTASIWTQKEVGTGKQLWSEDHDNIAVNEGIFTLNLGNTTSLGQNLNFTDTLYLQINVTNFKGDFKVLEPRIKMAQSPFSMASSRASADFDLNQKKIFNGTLVNASKFSLNNNEVFMNVTSGNELTFTDANNPSGKTLDELFVSDDSIDWTEIIDNMVLDADTLIDTAGKNFTITEGSADSIPLQIINNGSNSGLVVNNTSSGSGVTINNTGTGNALEIKDGAGNTQFSVNNTGKAKFSQGVAIGENGTAISSIQSVQLVDTDDSGGVKGFDPGNCPCTIDAGASGVDIKDTTTIFATVDSPSDVDKVDAVCGVSDLEPSNEKFNLQCTNSLKNGMILNYVVFNP